MISLWRVLFPSSYRARCIELAPTPSLFRNRVTTGFLALAWCTPFTSQKVALIT